MLAERKLNTKHVGEGPAKGGAAGTAEPRVIEAGLPRPAPPRPAPSQPLTRLQHDLIMRRATLAQSQSRPRLGFMGSMGFLRLIVFLGSDVHCGFILMVIGFMLMFMVFMRSIEFMVFNKCMKSMEFPWRP